MSVVVKTHRCPICHKIYTDNQYAPFCSKRCADVDLGRWFSESYSVPSEDLDDTEIAQLQEALENVENNEQ